MKHLLILICSAALLASASGQDAAEQGTDYVGYLRNSVIEARLALATGMPYEELSIFNEVFADDRVTVDVFIDEIAASGSWTLIDEAVGICLAEAERIKVTGAAGTNTPAYRAARKRYLEASARLLDTYGGLAGSSADSTLGAFSDPATWVDWALPGDIQIKEAAGSVRINTATGEIGGRLSGEIGLPKFDANFAVPNASFDSRGNIDLTAFGTASFPPDSPDKVTLSVPSRRPLILHLSEDGDFRIAGSGRVKLPDGNQFEAHFDADHPMYEFGLAYAGNLTLAMAKEVTLLRPTIDPEAVFEPGVIIGLGQFFGSLGKGYESFMEDSPDLPSLDDLNIGVAPEFKSPETVVSFDVFDAWAIGLVNDEVRPLINGSYEASARSARDQIRTMRDSVRSAQSELAPTLEQIRKLRRNLEQLAKARKVLEDAEAAAKLGDDAVVSLAEVIAATEQAAEIAEDYMENTPAATNFKKGFATVELWLNARATAQGTGSEIGIDLGVALPKIDQWTDTAFGPFGFDRAGNVIDQAKVDALQPADLRVLALVLLELEGKRQGLGEDTVAGIYFTFLDREFDLVNALYQQSIADGDIEARAQYAAHLHDLMIVATQSGFTEDAVKLGTMFEARDDTIAAIVAAGGDTPEQQVLARKIFLAGQELVGAQSRIIERRVDTLLGNRVGRKEQEKKDLAVRAELGEGNHSLFSQWYFALKALSSDGVISATQRNEYETSLTGLMRYYADAQVESFSDVTKIEQNLEGAFDALLVMLDLLAIAEDMVPTDTALIGELQANWQALHVPWIGVAEAKRAHFYLSAYAVEIGNATERYGDGMSTALKASAKAAGNEAVRGLGRVIDYLAGVVDGFSLDEFDFALPGDMQVQRAFGVLKFDVAEEPPSWDFEFGGQLYFSDYDLTFAVPSAHIFSDGMFDVSLMTEGPVPFGYEETMRLSTAFSLAGNVLTPSISNASADGILTYTPEGGVAETFTGSLSYAFDNGHEFSFSTSFDAPRQLFTEEVASFSGGFGFALSLDESGIPQQGNVSANIDLGFLLREGADLTTLDPEDYWLNFDGSAEVDFSVTDRTADFRLLSGTLTLPPDIFSNATATAPATIALESVVCVRIDFANQTISWCDEAGDAVLLSANNIHAMIPGLAGSDLEITTGKLRLSGSEFPVIEQLDAALTLPLPGGDQTTVNIDVAHWPIDGLPQSVAITLKNPMTLVDLDGIAIKAKALQGIDYGGCPAGLSFEHDAATGQTTFRIASAIAIDIDPKMLWDAGDNSAVGTEVSGCFTWEVGQLPTFELSDFTVSGRFRIGGANGIELLGARGKPAATITFANLENVFHRPPAVAAEAFSISIEGAVNFSDIIQFELISSAFIWDGSIAASDLIPRFEPGGVCFVAGEEGIELIANLLPLYPTELCLSFNDRTLPIFPAGNEMGLFDPLNINVIASGVVTLPNGGAVEGGSPGISGAVTNVNIKFIDVDGFPVPDFVATMSSITSLTMELKNLDIPPLGGITGGLHLGNLDAVAAGNYDELFFAGNLGAKINDVGASVLLAAKPTEFVGACFSLNAGPAGIPIDGGTLGGILLTGASGGINFKNSFSNPCDFSSYITIGANNIPTSVNLPEEGEAGRDAPGGGPSDVEELQDGIADDLATNPVNTAPDIPDASVCLLPMTPEFNCIQGQFPPASLNPLCEKLMIGDEERVIFKGTNLNPTQVNALLAEVNITPAQLSAMTPGAAIDTFVDRITLQVRSAGDAIIDAVPPGVDPRAKEFFASKITDLVNSVDDSAKNFLREGFSKALKADPDANLYQILLAKAAEGIPCFDVTLRLEGTLSHSAISTVLSGTGAVTLSTTGTAVLDGSINLVGIPVGNATLAFSLTTPEGDIDPTFGGVAEVALGPLELGRMTMSLGCQGCYGAVTDAMFVWMAENANSFASDPNISAFLTRMMDAAVPLSSPRDLGTAVDVHFMDLTLAERQVWMASFFNVFQILVDAGVDLSDPGASTASLPIPVSPDTMRSFLSSFTSLITKVLVNVNPRICFGGDVGPKIFGFPLTGGAESSFGGGLLYQRSTDPVTEVDYQELVAQMQFSPSQTLSSVLLGSYAYVLPLAVDTAQMGYSLRMPAFTEQNVETMLCNPAQFATDQLSTLVEDSVFSFGYQLQPLGYKLADGQARVLMPRLGGHPSRTNRFMRDPLDPENTIALDPWVNPDDLNNPLIPTRMEIILAALSKGQLQNPLWRGTSQDLQSLFAAPGTGCYQPSNSGCDLLTGQVAARVDPAAFVGMDLANHYFPHGGFIGGAELALPNLIARPVPTDRLAMLLEVPTVQTIGDWIDNAGILFGDPSKTVEEDPNVSDPGYAYFTGTTCSGQMAMYLPFPGPPADFDLDNASLQEFVDSISSLDMSQLASRGLPSFRDDLILLSGWLDAPVMGMPVAQGSVNYDPARQCFSLMAEIPQTWDHDGDGNTPEIDSWLAKFVTGEVEIEIKGADYMVDPTAPPTGGMAERLAEIGLDLAGANTSTAANLISEIKATMPKASMEATAGVQVPAELAPFIRASGAASLSVFAFSPEFEPSYIPTDFTPYAVSRRRGGFGLVGTFDVGYFPATGDPFVIDGLTGSFSISPDANIGVFPSVAGSLMVDKLDIPGFPTVSNAEFSFNNSPDNLAPYTLITGEVEPLVFKVPGSNIDLLRIRAVDGGNLQGEVAVRRDDTAGVPTVGTSIKPAIADMPFLGQDVAVSIYGGVDGDGNFTPFTFNSAPGQRWQATVCLHSANDKNVTGPADLTPPTLAIGDPFTAGSSDTLLAFTPNTTICGTLCGEGLNTFSLELDLPNGITATFFPGKETEINKTFGGTGGAKFYVDNGGRFYVDFGNVDNIGLPGVLTASGRFEFGNNPVGENPDIATAPTALAGVSFPPTDIAATATASVEISNDGFALANVALGATPGADFTCSETGFALLPGGSRTVDVVFHPSAVGLRSGMLQIISDDPVEPLITIPLNGVANSGPKYFQSNNEIAFGDTRTGGVATGSVTVGNAGSETLQINSVTKSGSGATRFSVSPAAGLTLQPGESQLFVVEYAPTAKVGSSATLSFATATQGTHTVGLSGTGTGNRWITVMDEATSGRDANLNKVLMLDSQRGYVIGDDGTFLETSSGGHAWTQRELTAFNLTDIHAETQNLAALKAEYHFEEPKLAKVLRDSGPEGLHIDVSQSFPAASNLYGAGRFGAGMSFFSTLALGNTNTAGWHLKLPNFDLNNQWAIAMWVNPIKNNDGQCFLSKATTGSADQFVFGFYGGQHRLLLGSQVYDFGTKSTGWQHFLIQGNYTPASGRTSVRIYRNGTSIGSRNFTGDAAQFGGGRPWVLGADFDGANLSDWLYGSIDEVYFFDQQLSAIQQEIVANSAGPERLVVVGGAGTVLQSETRGANWHMPFDQIPNGWRQSQQSFSNNTWNATTIDSTNRILLGGSTQGGSFLNQFRTVMREEHSAGEYDSVTFDSGAGSPINEVLFDLATLQDGNSYGVSSFGRLYKAGASWNQHGSLDLSGVLYDLEAVGSNDYIAVGSSGAVVRSLDGGNPASVTQAHTTAALRGAAWNGLTRVEVVGNGGTHLLSTNNGSSWTTKDEGLQGNNRGIDIVRAGSQEHAWVVGEDFTINYRPSSSSAQPYITFNPGKLDFGFVPVGHSRTLPLSIRNRGSQDLVIASLSISGTGFSIVQGDVSRLGPGDGMTLQIRYKPADDSKFDAGNLLLGTNNRSEPFLVPLQGSAGDNDWTPILLGSAGNPVSGTVIDMVFTHVGVSASHGYVIVDTGGASQVWRSTNSGQNWSRLSISAPTRQFHKFYGIDAVRTGSGDTVVLAGAVHGGAGLVDGVVLYSTNSGNSWTARTPADVMVASFTDAAIYPDADEDDVVVVCSSTGSGNGDVWQTNDLTKPWVNRANTPGNSYDGTRLDLVPVLGTNPAENGTLVVTSSGSTVFSRDWGAQWAHSPFVPFDGIPGVAFPGAQTVNDMAFGVNDSPLQLLYGYVVGTNGLFWRWEKEPTTLSPFQTQSRWVPASNAEVFGTTDLEAINFHEDGGVGLVAGGSKLFVSENHGRSWVLEFDAGEGAHLTSVATYPINLKRWTAGSLDGNAIVYRYRPTTLTNQPLLSANDIEILGTTAPGGSLSKAVTIENLGNADLDLHDFQIETDDPISRFRISGGKTETSLPPNTPRHLTVVFDATPEPIDIEALDPLVFLRFEQGWEDEIYTDHSEPAEDATAPATASRKPRIHQDVDGGKRDRCLKFDGGDYAEFSGHDSLRGDFSIACWVDVKDPNRNQAFFGKHNAGGGNFILGGIYGGGYSFRIRDSEMRLGTPTAGWQHIAVTCKRNGGVTEVTFYKDGVEVWSDPTFDVAGSIAGKPWVLGAEWDSATSIGDFLDGCIDDFALFDRVLDSGDIAALRNKSPLCGEHRATLVINSGSENGRRTVGLRASVGETTKLMIIDTVPSGIEILVDGEPHVTPAAFAVRENASDSREWVEGSQHKIIAPEAATVTTSGGLDINYMFADWDRSRDRTISVIASRSAGRVVANYTATVQPPQPMISVGTGGLPVKGDCDTGFDISAALAGTPKGPFVRITDGSASLPSIDFEVGGEIMIGIGRMTGSLVTSDIALPPTGAEKFIEIGASAWAIDLDVANQKLEIKAQAPPLKLLGEDRLPAGGVCIEVDVASSAYAAKFTMADDFKAIPKVLEFGAGEVTLQHLGGGAFELALDGNLRLIDLHGVIGIDDWAVDRPVHFTAATPNFTVAVDDLLSNLPADLFDNGLVELDWGEILIKRTPAWGLEINDANLRVFDESVATVSGSASLDGKLILNGSLEELRLVDSNLFSLKPAAGSGAAPFQLEIDTAAPSVKIDLPDLRLHSTAAGLPDGSIIVPGFRFDSTGAFDTGQLALPTGFSFDGINITAPDEAKLADNHLRLARDASGAITFNVAADLPFLPGCPPHDLSISVANSGDGGGTVIGGSYGGKFCVMPERISINFAVGQDFQFSKSAFGFTVFFGQDGAGYRNDFTGICVGDCP